MTRLGRFSRLIVTASDGGSLLRSSVWDELLALDDAVYNMTVHYDGLDFRFEDLCARWDGYCQANDILNLADVMAEVEAGAFNLTYPLTFDPYTFQQYNLPASFGGLKVSDTFFLIIFFIYYFYYFFLGQRHRHCPLRRGGLPQLLPLPGGGVERGCR